MYTQKILDMLDLEGSLQLKNPIRGLPGYTAYELIDSLIKHDTVKAAGIHLGYSDNPLKQSIRQYIEPLVDKIVLNGHWGKLLLSLIEYRKCYVCNAIRPCTEFHKDSSDAYGLSGECATCKNSRTKFDKETLALRVVPWTDKTAIRNFYNNCPKEMVVDHYRPLRGKLVSGLHVLSNLRYMTKEANLAKSNKFEVSDEV